MEAFRPPLTTRVFSWLGSLLTRRGIDTEAEAASGNARLDPVETMWRWEEAQAGGDYTQAENDFYEAFRRIPRAKLEGYRERIEGEPYAEALVDGVRVQGNKALEALEHPRFAHIQSVESRPWLYM